MDNSIDKLRDIWDDIPEGLTEPIDLSQEEFINRYMDVFHFGNYFYLIFNTLKAEIEYVSPSIEHVLGYTAEEFYLPFVIDRIHPEDLPYFYHYEQSAVRFFSGLTKDLVFKYKFAYDYRFKTKSGAIKRIQQQTIPLLYFPEGGVRTLTILTDISHLNVTGIPKLSFIGMQGAPSYYNVPLTQEFTTANRLFTPREREILRYMVQGKKSEEIATLLGRSIFTIRNHRKNILLKSGCKNLQELLVKSIREGWV
ncbi:LuxR C-terminal-related transcriptional regulator [Myroides fluvii]|uniref:LuxR C-terminal-related transcriptional regulator n=1 Tax=Myroides fluvii TaxID=2572594 RepID=UPI00131D46DB|nr:LuxR C-terminal-related transcriptional regulator [Myroides fluvii]